MHVPIRVVGEREVSAIGRGMCVLLGISRHDTEREAEWMWVRHCIYSSNDYYWLDSRATKLTNLRIFDNPETGKAWDKSVAEVGMEILCVSQVCDHTQTPLTTVPPFFLYIMSIQFTLCHVLKGNKPDFHNAMTAELSQQVYTDFLKLLGSKYKPEAIKGRLVMSPHSPPTPSPSPLSTRWWIWCIHAGPHSKWWTSNPTHRDTTIPSSKRGTHNRTYNPGFLGQCPDKWGVLIESI